MIEIPEFWECLQAEDEGTANPLEKFIYENDVAGDDGVKFRRELIAMIRFVESQA